MTCHAIRTTLAAALLVSMVAPLPLRADPITVTGGTVEVYASIRQARITFVGNDFRLETGTEDFFTFVGALSPFPAGTAVNLGGVWRPTDVRGGEAIVNGVHYEEIYFGNLQSGGSFTTSSVVLSGEGIQTVKLPFTFTGFVTGFSSINAQPEDVVFTASLVGSGTATAGFSNPGPCAVLPRLAARQGRRSARIRLFPRSRPGAGHAGASRHGPRTVPRRGIPSAIDARNRRCGLSKGRGLSRGRAEQGPNGRDANSRMPSKITPETQRRLHWHFRGFFWELFAPRDCLLADDLHRDSERECEIAKKWTFVSVPS